MNNETRKRRKVLFPMGGKGGTGKTTVLTALSEWFSENGIPCVRLDLDTENKVKGSFCHFFPEGTQKIDINTRAGLDAFIDLADEASIILADMGSGSGKVAHGWFDSMYESISDTMSFTALGLVTSDPASVESVLAWAARLQNRVSYVIVLNKQEDDASTFTYWEQTAEAIKFRSSSSRRSSRWIPGCPISSTPCAIMASRSPPSSIVRWSSRNLPRVVW
jgi:hypothetical protein